MTQRERYITYMARVDAWTERTSARLRAQILARYFGGCGCRMHNCLVNYENGRAESSVKGKSHKELAQLARQFNYQQEKVWRESRRLKDAFWSRYLGR